MQIVDIEQQTPEWFDLRKKKMTASNATAIAANGKGLDTYAMKLMQEFYSTGEPKRYKGAATDMGNELEDSAGFVYAMETGIEVRKVGFVIHSDYAGCSPDLFADVDGLAEIKCFEDKHYFEYLNHGIIDTGYNNQMQCQMMMCRKDWCDYVVFNPNFKKDIIITRVLPDKKIFEKLRIGLISGEEKMRAIEAKMNTILL